MMTNAKPRKIEGRPAGDWLVCLLACGLLTSLAGFAAAQQGAPNLSAPETRQPLVGAPGRYELPPPSSPGGASAAETVPTPPPTPIPGSRQIIEDVQVIGNSFTSRLQIDKMLQTRKDRDFDPERLQKDVRTLIMSNLFRDVKTYTKQSKEGVIVVFELFERPRIHEVLYIGNRGISDKKLGKESGLKKGDPLSAFNVEDARRKIEELYHKKGFPKATVAIREGNKPNDKNAIFDINEGPIQRISGVTFEGNTIASASRLTTLVGSKPMFKVVPSQVDREKIDEDIKKVNLL